MSRSNKSGDDDLSTPLLIRGFLGGFLMGLANLVPGISGGTMLLATGIYDRFISAVSQVTTLRFRIASIALLAVIVIGAGCAIVASDVAPVREALEDGDGAQLVDHDDPDATVDAISRLLDAPETRLRLARSARASALGRYDSGWLWPARAALLVDVVRNSGRF